MSNIYGLAEQYAPNAGRYSNMDYRRSGNSGIKMSAISLGLWHNFGGVDVYENMRTIMRGAFDAGITCFDLANNYGPPYGSAETNFGKLMTDDFAPFRDEMFITSKAGYDMWPGPYGAGGSRKYLLSSLDQSLKRMKLDYVDLFYHHCMDAETPLEESMLALVQAIKSGKALYVGLSNYSPEKTEKAIGILQENGVPCLIEQSAYNMLNRKPEKEGLLSTLEKHSVGFAAFSPLAQGLLTGKYNNGVPKDSRIAGYSKFLNENNLTEELAKKIVALGTIADNRGQSMSELALSWLLSDSRVTTVIIGASRLSQLQENLKAVNKASFVQEEIDTINAILD